jgi:hypothetical protein
MAPAPDGYRSIKIRKDSYDRLQELIHKLAQDGWSSIGSSRRDELTAANVLDEAIRLTLTRTGTP